MASSSVGLQHLIDTFCANYEFENYILFNRSKFVCMVVKPRGGNISTHLMYINGVAFGYTDRVKYIGILQHAVYFVHCLCVRYVQSGLSNKFLHRCILLLSDRCPDNKHCTDADY